MPSINKMLGLQRTFMIILMHVCINQVGKDAVIIEADAIKNRDAMYKHLSSWDLTRDDPTLSSYVHEYSTKAAEILLAAAGESFKPTPGLLTKHFVACKPLTHRKLCTLDNGLHQRGIPFCTSLLSEQHVI